jgi:alkylation response protein AidB-like acyl-CoA dehydrogenase
VSALDPLTDEQREIRELVRTIARERIAPRAAEIDKSAEFPWDVVEVFRENDLFGVMYDEDYGGIGASALMTLVMIEELSKVCATSGLIMAVQELGSLGIKLAGTAEQKERFLPKLASGEWLAAYALTEPESGSDSAAMRTSAVRDGAEYVLNGGKRFITNAGVASLYVVFAKTDSGAAHSGISAFVVEADAPGFSVGRIEPKMGIKGSTTGEVFFDDCRIPVGNLLGEEGEGFKIAMRILDRSRPGIGAQGLGLAQGATDYAVEYARSRDISSVAEAPSESCDELPAVTEPWPLVGSKCGLSASRPSSVVSGRLHSSLSATTSSLPITSFVFLSNTDLVTLIGAISFLKKPSCWARAVRCWLSREYSSWTWRLTL